MFVFMLIVVILQLWLLTATMNAWLGGDESIVWPGLAVNAGGLALNVGLLRYLRQLERMGKSGSSTRPIPPLGGLVQRVQRFRPRAGSSRDDSYERAFVSSCHIRTFFLTDEGQR
jgi:hypothetical protein